MLLNALETRLMNNPVRASLQRHFEAPLLKRMGGTDPIGRALEIGCGRGVGTEIILDVFGATEVDAFDLDPRMVDRARERLAPRGGRVRVWRGDAEHIDAEAGRYDAVFDFGIIHHVPAWRAAVAEAHRVLRPGGRFYVEEVLAGFIDHPLWRLLLDHPKHDRFDAPTFRAALVEQGFRVLGTQSLSDQFAWFVAERR